MAERTVVQCQACGRPYSARLVDKEIILPTDDGNCACGSDAFVGVSDVQRQDATAGKPG